MFWLAIAVGFIVVGGAGYAVGYAIGKQSREVAPADLTLSEYDPL